MRASIDLSLNFALHEISEGLQSVVLGGHISFNQWTIRLAFSQTLLCMAMGTSSLSEHIYLSFCLFVLPSWLKFFLIKDENYLVWIRWFSSGAQRFQHSWQSCILCQHVLKIKTVCLHVIIPAMHSFSMRPAKYFYDNPLPNYLDPKTVLIYRPHPVEGILHIVLSQQLYRYLVPLLFYRSSEYSFYCEQYSFCLDIIGK